VHRCFGVLLFFLPLSIESRPSHREIAEAWAPIIYKDIDPAFVQRETGFSPADHLVDLFFDGNVDLRDNSRNVFRLPNEKAKSFLSKASIYFSVIETQTHWYLNYILYHAIDLNIVSHSHDTENIWKVIRKKPDKKWGELEFFVTNAHGHPHVYGDTREAKIVDRRLNRNFLSRFLPVIDRHSEAHHTPFGAEYVLDPLGAKRFRLFVAAKTHAIYKFHSNAWRKGHGAGAVYLPRSCKEACRQEGRFLENPAREISYELKSWDEIYFNYLSSEHFVFTHRANLFLSASARNDLPTYLVPGWGETEARAIVFSAVSFKTPYRLADPARLHRYWLGSKTEICLNYVQNPYLQNDSRESRALVAVFD